MKNKYILDNSVIPAFATHPGHLLTDELSYRHITTSEFAQKTGLNPATIKGIMAGRINITPEIAIAFGKALKIKTDYWLRLQYSYHTDLIKIQYRKMIEKSNISKNAKASLIKAILQKS